MRKTQCSVTSRGPIGVSTLIEPDPELLYASPFPYIQGKHGGESYIYQEAVKTLREFERLETNFGANYSVITHLQSEIIMKLDVNGNIELSLRNTSLQKSNPINPAVGRAMKVSFTTPFVQWNGNGLKYHTQQARKLASQKLIAKIASVLTLASMRKDFDDIDLVKHQAGSRKKEAKKKKLIFIMKALARAQASDADYAARLIAIKNNYDEFEAKLRQLNYFYTIEQKLSGKTSETKAWKRRDY